MELNRRFQPYQIVFTFLAALHILFSLFINPIGYVTGDSGEYHYMVRNFVRTGSFYIENGYDIYPSPALMVAQLVAPNGKLVAKSPEVYTLLMAPAYALLGLRGIFVMNALMFIGVCFLIFKICRLLYSEHETACWAVGIYAFCTYAWEYSQSTYPHIPATFFILLAFFCVMRWLHTAEADKALRWMLWAGLAIGCAVGIRLDSVLAIPAVLLPILFRVSSQKLLALLVFVAGGLPAAIFLAASNWIKFGTLNPFSYGEAGHGHLATYIPVGIIVITGIALLCLKVKIVEIFGRYPNRAKLILWFTAIATFTIFFPQIRRLASGMFSILISANRFEPLWSGYKSALLQSCPYLAALIGLRQKEFQGQLSRETLLYLFTVPVVFSLFYGYFSWHGSQTLLNMRYLNPSLPFLSILFAPILQSLVINSAWSIKRILLAFSIIFFAWTIFFYYTYLLGQNIEKYFVYVIPISLSFILTFFMIFKIAKDELLKKKIILGIILICISASSSMALTRDYLNSAIVRATSNLITEEFKPYLKKNSTVIASENALFGMWRMPDYFEDFVTAKLIENEKHEKNIDGLLFSHILENRNVYFCLKPEDEKILFDENILKGFNLELVHDFIKNKKKVLSLYKVLGLKGDAKV